MLELASYCLYIYHSNIKSMAAFLPHARVDCSQRDRSTSNRPHQGVLRFSMNSQRLLSWLLRLAGSVEIIAFFAVVLPRSWMEVSHAWLGLGEMPRGPIIMFMIRQASYTYGIHGVSLWVLASDAARFRTLVLLNGIAYLLSAPVFFLIDFTSGMPWWWTAGDTFGCGLLGAALLWLNQRGLQNREW